MPAETSGHRPAEERDGTGPADTPGRSILARLGAMAATIAVLSQKGGTGKTTTVRT